MSWLTWVLFESLPALAILLGMVLFALLVHWRRSGRARPLLVGLALSVVMLSVQALVITKREHAGRILSAIESDLLAGRSDALATALGPEFSADGLDRAEFLARVRELLGRVRIHWLERWDLRVGAASGRQFTVSASYLSEISHGPLDYTPRSTWQLTFARGTAGWEIVDIQCVHIDGVTGLRWRSMEY